MTPRVYVLLPVHNRCRITKECIASLSAQTWREFHLILIDDGCTDGTVEMVRGYIQNATVLRGAGDWWWGGSLHQGYLWLRRSQARPDDIVLMINDDTTFEPSFLQSAVEALEGRERTLLLAQLFDSETRQFVEAGVNADWSLLRFRGVKDPAEINCFSTRGLFLRVSDMIAIGGFHPVLLPHYASDYEYTMRAYRKGYALHSSPRVRVWFRQDATGVRQPDKVPAKVFLRTMFSKRALHNPLYWSSFVLLCSPLRYMPANLYRVWMGFLRQTRRTFFRG